MEVSREGDDGIDDDIFGENVVGVGAADKMIDLVKNMIPVNVVEAAFKQVKLVYNLYQIIFLAIKMLRS